MRNRKARRVYLLLVLAGAMIAATWLVSAWVWVRLEFPGGSQMSLEAGTIAVEFRRPSETYASMPGVRAAAARGGMLLGFNGGGESWGWWVVVPLWAPALVCLGGAACASVFGWGSRRRRVEGKCGGCGYDCRGLAGDAVCPECGDSPATVEPGLASAWAEGGFKRGLGFVWKRTRMVVLVAGAIGVGLVVHAVGVVAARPVSTAIEFTTIDRFAEARAMVRAEVGGAIDVIPAKVPAGATEAKLRVYFDPPLAELLLLCRMSPDEARRVADQARTIALPTPGARTSRYAGFANPAWQDIVPGAKMGVGLPPGYEVFLLHKRLAGGDDVTAGVAVDAGAGVAVWWALRWSGP